MKNPFKKILGNERLPESLKQKVLNDIALIKLTIDLADLMAVKYPDSIEEILKITNKTK